MSAVSRRRLLAATAAGMLLGAARTRAQGSDYPSRRMTVIVPFPPGGSADFFARSVFTRMAASVGQTIVIDNKDGASGIIGAKAVINAAPDGYTLLASSITSVTIPPSMTAPPAFDPLKDLTPVTGVGMVPAVLVVHPTLGIKTFAELLAYAKANPGKLNLASSGTGTIAHLAGVLLMRETGIKITHIPYRGAPPAVLDLLSGRADLPFSDARSFSSISAPESSSRLRSERQRARRRCPTCRPPRSSAIPRSWHRTPTACSRRRARQPRSSTSSMRWCAPS